MKNEQFHIPKLARACNEHFEYDSWLNIDKRNCLDVFSREQIEDMIELSRSEKPNENPLSGNINIS